MLKPLSSAFPLNTHQSSLLEVSQIREETVQLAFAIEGGSLSLSLEFSHSLDVFDDTVLVRKRKLFICFQLKRANRVAHLQEMHAHAGTSS